MGTAAAQTFASSPGVAVGQNSVPHSPELRASLYNGERDSVTDHTMAQVMTLRNAMPMASGWTWVAALVATYRSAATPSASAISPSDPEAALRRATASSTSST